ncbi:uncharacterized protein [Rutidosis leptorrhynchoides]|uniref:uncharacterized protein isoform X2 n=1 Tax=Rutidosis leptorrhynchoides TaxID=125765 RepID=UPI003A992773
MESGIMESEFVDLDADTEELDIPNFVDDLKALMVDDSEDEVVLDSDDDDGIFNYQKEGKVRGSLWRRASAVDARSTEVWSSEGSNLTDKKSDSCPIIVPADTRLQETRIARSKERNFSYNENVPRVDPDQFNKNCNKVEGDEFVIFKAQFENENGAYDESQEPGESSQANALEFVDRYLSVSVVNSSPEAMNLKVRGLRSPLSSCAKGSKNLAVKTNLLSNIGISTFDWDDNQLHNGRELFLKKKQELDVQREKRLDERSEDGLQELALVDSERMYRVNEFDEQLGEELLKYPSENGNVIDAVNMFDVGFDTQMAAEAMEALLYTPPVTVNAVNQMKSNIDLPSTVNVRKDSSTETMKKLHYKPLKVYRRKKQRKHSDKEVNNFSPIACRTRHGSSVKRSKRTEDTCQPKNITRDKLDNDYKRKLGDLDTGFLLGKLKEATKDEATFVHWKWPKKRRTCRTMRQNATYTSTLMSPVVGVGNGNLSVGPGEIEGNFREAFCMSNVKRKARSAFGHRSTGGNKILKKWSTQKTRQSCLADVTNTNCASMNYLPALGDEKKMNALVPNRKRSIKKNSTVPFVRNGLTRLGCADSFSGFISKHLRRRRSKAEIRVLFSQNLDVDVAKQLRKIMTKLGFSIAKDCSDATHFVVDRFARTKKMLEAMAFGKPVVTPLWLESCEQAGYVIDEKNYLLRDAKKEKELGFSMPVSLSRAKTHQLLKVIEGVQQASMESDNFIILSCERDYEACVPFLDKGAAAYSSELLLNGIIIQKLEYARHQLFNGHIIMKRYARQRQKDRSQCPRVG